MDGVKIEIILSLGLQALASLYFVYGPMEKKNLLSFLMKSIISTAILTIFHIKYHLISIP